MLRHLSSYSLSILIALSITNIPDLTAKELRLIDSTHIGQSTPPTAEKKPPLLTNTNLAIHTMFLNPRYMDAEISGTLRLDSHLDITGFVGVVPTTWGYGGSHYGELKTAFRLLKGNAFSIGPAVERVTASNISDFTKLGISGKASLKNVLFFDWEVFPYSTGGSKGAGFFYSAPLPGRWKIDGFLNYMIDGTAVGKINLHYQLPHKFEVLVEYFHNGFVKGSDQDRIGVGIAYKIQ